MQKARILHLISSNIFSGLEKVASDIAVKLSGNYDLALCVVKGSVEENVSKLGINHITVRSFTLPEIMRVMNVFKPNIIHAHDYRASVLAALLPYPKVKIISHIHHNNPWTMKLNCKTLGYAAILPRLDKILAVSSSVINEHIMRKFLEPKSIVLPNSVDVSKIVSDSLVAITEDSDMVFVGRLEESKAPLEALSIISEIKKSKNNIKVLMIGDGSLRTECEKAIERLGLKSNVRLLGFIPNPYPYMRSSKLLMLTSKWEGFGLVVLEAMALGKPVLAKPVGGVIDLVKHGQNGYFCNNHREFVQRALEIVTGDVEVSKLERACIYSAKRHSNNFYYEKLSSVYDNCLISAGWISRDADF